MERPQMIHMACEGVLIGGLSLYFSKQLKQQTKEIEELKAIIAKNQAANEKRFEVVFNFLDSVNGGFMPPQQREAPREDRVLSQQKVNPAVAAQQKRQPQREVKKSKESYAPPREDVREEEMKRLPQKKKSVIQQTVEEPSVLTIITKKNVEASKEDMNIEVCDPNDENCTDDILEEMASLEETVEEDMDE
jgi:hypothetical protein